MAMHVHRMGHQSLVVDHDDEALVATEIIHIPPWIVWIGNIPCGSQFEDWGVVVDAEARTVHYVEEDADTVPLEVDGGVHGCVGRWWCDGGIRHCFAQRVVPQLALSMGQAVDVGYAVLLAFSW